MKYNIRKAIAVLVVIVAAYALFFSIVKIDPKSICVIQDLRSERMVKIVRPLAGNFSLAWQGAFPWWFLVSEVPAHRVVDFNARIVIPGLEDLKKESYHVHMPVRMKYLIDAEQFTDAGRLAEGGRGADELAEKYLQAELQRGLAPFLAPDYQPEAIAAQAGQAVEGAVDATMGDLSGRGIKVAEAKLAGTPILPDRLLYREGLQHAANLRAIENMLEKDLIEARNRVTREKIANAQLYERLREISKLISVNPDMLKYIYIDKMAGNVKLILSSDASGVPRMLELEKSTKQKKSREIDNLK